MALFVFALLMALPAIGLPAESESDEAQLTVEMLIDELVAHN